MSLLITILHFSLCWVSRPLRLSNGKPDERGMPHPLTALHPSGVPLAPQSSSGHLNSQGSPDPTGFPNASQQEPEEGCPGPVILPLSPLLTLHGTPSGPLASLAHHTEASYKLICGQTFIWTAMVGCFPPHNLRPLLFLEQSHPWLEPQKSGLETSWVELIEARAPPHTSFDPPLAFPWNVLTSWGRKRPCRVLRHSDIKHRLFFAQRNICPSLIEIFVSAKEKFLCYKRNIFVLRPVKSEFCIQRNIQSCRHLKQQVLFILHKECLFIFSFLLFLHFGSIPRCLQESEKDLCYFSRSSV